MPKSRQLAAIMFTDIVGYTELMGEDEQKALEILRTNRELQQSVIKQFDGTWIKEIGDGVLASFHTVTDAVLCATAIQQSCINITDLELRIGIHLGEVVFQDNDVFGDGVNIASRIQALAPIGGIWISESVNNNVLNKREIKTKYAATEILKNVKESVRIYEVITTYTNAQPTLTDKKTALKSLKKSLAVLPFLDLSPAHDQEYLGDGLAEELINTFSQLKELKVIGRTSSFSFKGTKTDLKTIGKTLNADTILEGSVQKSGSRIRITTQLINAADGYHIWSQRYDREMNDIFSLQDDICSKIAEHLKLTLLQDTETAIVKKQTDNLIAYEMFLKGDFYHKKYSTEGFEKAIDFFQKAVELDRNYADAWLSLGLCQFEQQSFNTTFFLSPINMMQTVNSYAAKAIAIDEFNADAHFLLALIHFNYDYDWEKVGLEIAMGRKYMQTPYPLMFLPLEPWYRATLYSDFDFAVSELQKGIENDPLSILYLMHQALMNLNGLRNYEKTRIILNRILELDSRFTEAWGPMSLSWLFEGNYEPALEYARKYYDILEGKGHGAANLIMCLAASGQKNEAEKLYAFVKETLPFSQFSTTLHAKANEYLGLFDKAFEYLEKAFEEKDLWFSVNLKISPEWDLLRHDPRFQKLLERMNYPE